MIVLVLAEPPQPRRSVLRMNSNIITKSRKIVKKIFCCKFYWVLLYSKQFLMYTVCHVVFGQMAVNVNLMSAFR